MAKAHTQRFTLEIRPLSEKTFEGTQQKVLIPGLKATVEVIIEKEVEECERCLRKLNEAAKRDFCFHQNGLNHVSGSWFRASRVGHGSRTASSDS